MPLILSMNLRKIVQPVQPLKDHQENLLSNILQEVYTCHLYLCRLVDSKLAYSKFQESPNCVKFQGTNPKFYPSVFNSGLLHMQKIMLLGFLCIPNTCWHSGRPLSSTEEQDLRGRFENVQRPLPSSSALTYLLHRVTIFDNEGVL